MQIVHTAFVVVAFYPAGYWLSIVVPFQAWLLDPLCIHRQDGIDDDNTANAEHLLQDALC